MSKITLQPYYSWFDDYVSNYYNNNNEDIQKNIALKKEHTKRVCDIMRLITASLSLPEKAVNIGELTALFHDIGRFEQYTRYQTFVDHKSVDHAKFGVQILQETGILSDLESDARNNILKAIGYHNIRVLPANESKDCLLYSSLIRDADKLDIYHIIIEYLDECASNPNKALEVWPRINEYSPKIIDSILHSKCVDYKDLKTFYDRRLLEISWVFDINFPYSLKYVVEKGYIDRLFQELPKDETMEMVRKHIYDYIGNV